MVTYEGGREEEKEITVWQRKEMQGAGARRQQPCSLFALLRVLMVLSFDLLRVLVL